MKVNLNKRFVDLRKKIGLSQKQAAEYLEIDQSYVSKIENGERVLTLDIAEKMCNLIGYDVSYFYGNDDKDSLNVSFRTNTLDVDDLKALARVNEIAMKLKEMKKMSQEIKDE